MAPPTIGLERLNILVLKFALSPQHVKAFVKNHKNDANDALTIFEAANRPGMHFVPVKNLYQQDLSVLHNVRQSLVQKRVAISNQIRGLAAEYGIIFPQRSKAITARGT
ncbi:IS110 family transposase [Xenorhabdus budapestensis]|uniref:IS110 family transposase n=1 Tax=Xenorhabdus budapestensis TaxID=290110 RepID=UPI003A890BD5